MLRSFVRTFVGEDEEDKPEMLTNESRGSFVDVGPPRAKEAECDSDSEHEAKGKSEAPPTEEKSTLPTPDPEPTCRTKCAKPGHARLTTEVDATEAAVQAETVEEQVEASTPSVAEPMTTLVADAAPVWCAPRAAAPRRAASRRRPNSVAYIRPCRGCSS